MSQICGIHQCEMKWKTGVSSKTGKNYAFWSCAQKMPDGSWCTFKAPKPQGSVSQFSDQLNQSSSQTDQRKREDEITKTALAKSFIEAGRTFKETKMEASFWYWWIKGNVVDKPQEEIHVVFNNGSDVVLDDEPDENPF